MSVREKVKRRTNKDKMIDKMIEMIIVMMILTVVLHHHNQDHNRIEREDHVQNLIHRKAKRKEVVQESTIARSIIIVDLVVKIVKKQENTADLQRIRRAAILITARTTRVRLNLSKKGSSD